MRDLNMLPAAVPCPSSPRTGHYLVPWKSIDLNGANSPDWSSKLPPSLSSKNCNDCIQVLLAPWNINAALLKPTQSLLFRSRGYLSWRNYIAWYSASFRYWYQFSNGLLSVDMCNHLCSLLSQTLQQKRSSLPPVLKLCSMNILLLANVDRLIFAAWSFLDYIFADEKKWA